MIRLHDHDEAGFTLLEMVIAIMIMGVAVVTLVSALATMLQLSGQHRGHAVLEAGAHSYSQAVMAAAQFSTALTSDVDDVTTRLQVADSSLFKKDEYVSVDLETMQVTSVATSRIDVTRNINGDGGKPHTSGVAVSRLLMCPSPLELAPPAGTYATTPGVAVPTVLAVEYWNGSTFLPTSASTCTDPFNKAPCFGAILAECGTGLYRASISVTTAGDTRLRGVATTTTVLVRTGQA